MAKKGPLQTVQAFARLVARLDEPLRSRAELLIVGEGPLQDQLQELVDDQQLSGQVQLLGLRSPQQIADLMRSARGFVQHSVVAPDGDSEGNPVAVMEAQLSGLPVVATRHAGIPEVVLDGDTGLLVEEEDVEAMAQAMGRLLLEPEFAARLGAAGRRRVANGFTVQHHWSAVSGVLERSAAARSPWTR